MIVGPTRGDKPTWYEVLQNAMTEIETHQIKGFKK